MLWAFWLYPLLLLPLLLVLSRDYGNTWDEKIHQIEGEIAIDFWRGIPPPSTPPDNHASHLYGALFDVICLAAERVVPGDIWTTRHYVNAFFGWLGILFTGRLAARLFGRGTGLLAMVLLTLAPRYLGELSNNAKDVPFAALTVVSLYYLAAVEPRPPYLDRRSLLAFAAAAAGALDVRAGGLLLLVYLAAALAVALLRRRERQPRALASLALRVAAVSVAVFVFGTTFWPWAFVRPLVGPVLALQSFSHFFWNGSVAFAGRMIRAKALPWDYVPTWLLISTPPVLLVGALLSWARLRRGREALWPLLGLWSATVFPMLYVTVQHSTLYNGIRQLLFVIPTLVILAAAGWTALLRTSNGWTKALAAAALAAGLAEPLVFCLRNHPNEVVYFNLFVGGPRGAFGRYELDYFGNCVLQEVRWADRVARASGVSLVVSGQPPHVVQFDAERFPSALASSGPEQGLHHLEIATVWGVGPQMWRAAAAGDLLHWTATGDGAVLCVTAKGPRFADVAGRLRAPVPGPR
ncbi:MAG TPA: hypothetical protein VEQ10_21875 [Vicinamibacteria bacterium]|nr:hypothetical protein [Vicinamibacteria bacterium]